jgi:DNA-binding PadR family transcriptional regulator
MDTSKTEEVSKTELVLSHIAEYGPKTEYDMYKQLPKLSHGTIHFCLNKLADDGFLTFVPSKSREKRRKKLYHLTFIGTVSYLTWFLPSPITEPITEVTKTQIDEFQEHFDKESQSKIIKFLDKQGQLLKYAPFRESRWLSDHYPGIARVFLMIAYRICCRPPPLYKKPLIAAVIAATKEEPSPLTKEERTKELIPMVEEAWRDEFTNLFFQLIVYMKHKGKTSNYRLCRLAEEQLTEKRKETFELEQAVTLFSKTKINPEKRS